MRANTLTFHQKPLARHTHQDLASHILSLVMQHRRIPTDAQECAHHRCAACIAPYFNGIIAAIQINKPITFVLPAFPGKSPNPAKVLGSRPDMAERQSLLFLNTLCNRIKKVYPPGGKIILCSDGRVFNDVVGIQDDAITTYQEDLSILINEIKADNLATFNLDHIFSNASFDEMRTRLMSDYGESIEVVQKAVRANKDAQRLYCGLTRFLVEDATRPNMSMSKTGLQKQCRQRAYQVIQRSRAWDVLLAKFFPHAVRLSIHPQVCGSRKIGIHLMETEDEWLTAWHSVAVEVNGRFRLMKRVEAEKLGATLVFLEGRPSHYVLASQEQTP